MSVIYKKELPVNKYLFYCNIMLFSTSKRLRKKGSKIVNHQIDEYCYGW